VANAVSVADVVIVAFQTGVGVDGVGDLGTFKLTGKIGDVVRERSKGILVEVGFRNREYPIICLRVCWHKFLE